MILGKGLRSALQSSSKGARSGRAGPFAAAALAGLTGAAGVILEAIAAHAYPDERLHTAAHFMLFHAVAALAVSGLAAAVLRGSWFLIPAGLFLLGSVLFGGDLAARVLAGGRLFPMAAPLGGILLILGWVSVTLAAVFALRQTVAGKTDN